MFTDNVYIIMFHMSCIGCDKDVLPDLNTMSMLRLRLGEILCLAISSCKAARLSE